MVARSPHMFARFHNRVHWRGPGHDLTIDGRGSRFYDRFARRLFRGVYRRMAAEVASAAPTGGSVLDAGTGPGVLLVELADRRPDLSITGIDLSADMVAIAQRNVGRAGHTSRVEVRAADVADLPLPDASFDMVVSSLSMHHWGAVSPAVAELARVLRPGGALWIYDARSLPDDALVSAAREAFAGRSPERTLRRTGPGPVRWLARWTVSRPNAQAHAGGAGAAQR